MELSGLKIDKLKDDKFHIWKNRVQLIMSFRELDDYLTAEPPCAESSEYTTWSKSDRKSKSKIGLTILDSHLEQFQRATTARSMWKMFCDIYERHNLLNKLSASIKFFTAVMKDVERVLEFSSRILLLSSILKSMGVTVDNSEMEMALLNGLPEKFDSLISYLDAIGDDYQLFTFDFVLIRC